MCFIQQSRWSNRHQRSFGSSSIVLHPIFDFLESDRLENIEADRRDRRVWKAPNVVKDIKSDPSKVRSLMRGIYIPLNCASIRLCFPFFLFFVILGGPGEELEFLEGGKSANRVQPQLHFCFLYSVCFLQLGPILYCFSVRAHVYVGVASGLS